MLVDIEQVYGQLKISYIGDDGGLKMMELHIPKEEMYSWEYTNPNQTPDTKYTSWDNKPVRKTKTKFLNKFRIEEFLMNQSDEVKTKLYAPNSPKMFFCDIEVEITDDGFPHAHLAKNQITAMAFCSGTKVVVLGTRRIDGNGIKKIEKKINEHFKDFYEVEFNYYYFESEYDMLYSFMAKAIHKMPLITGWNFNGFDWPYIVNRCKRLGIDPAIASPSKKLHSKQELPVHRMVVDYLDIYKKWDRMVDVKENNSLDFVGKAVLGVPKIKYSGTLQDLYEQDFSEYIFYNAVDTLLVQFIHEKLQTMQTYLSLANITKVEAVRAFSPIWMAESTMTREFYRRKKIFPYVKNRSITREGYEGAFVFKPIPGIYEWVGSFDFASLYPSIMRQWNISPENYVTNTDEDVDTDKYIKTITGAVFDNSEDSVFRTILTEYYDKRKVAKGKMQDIEQEVAYLKNCLK